MDDKSEPGTWNNNSTACRLTEADMPVHQWRRVGNTEWHDACHEVAHMGPESEFESRTLYTAAYMRAAIEAAVKAARMTTTS